MRKLWSSSLYLSLVCLLLFAAPLTEARAGEYSGTEPALGGGIAAHVARFDFSEEWGETVDWAKLDPITRELAPDRLSWNALCLKYTGKPLTDFAGGLPQPDAAKFIAGLAQRLNEIAESRHVILTQNDWAIVACAVVPMQAVKGTGQKYVTSLGDTTRLGVAIQKLATTGVNCGDACVLSQAILRALNIEARFVGCHRKLSDPGQPVGHAMIEYFETNSQGKRFGHIVDAANMSGLNVGGDLVFRPPTARFQLIGDRLGRLQFLLITNFLHEQPALQGFDPPFSKEELASSELSDFATTRADTRLDARAVVLDSAPLEVNVPEGKSVIYKIMVGKDIPEGAIPAARMYRKGSDGEYRQLTAFSLHRRSDSKEVRLIWDGQLDGLTPGDYRAVFYVNDGSSGYRRGGSYAGEQIIHYGLKEKARSVSLSIQQERSTSAARPIGVITTIGDERTTTVSCDIPRRETK